MRTLRIAFAGTPEFAVPAFRRLLADGHTVVAVLTQPDRPAGRGRRLMGSAMKKAAMAAGVPVLTPTDGSTATAVVADLAADVIVVAAYGLLLPPALLAHPALGGLNIHASLLPRWRGAAPVARAIEAGDAVTGITIMQMAAGLDTGPILLQRSVAIGGDESAGALTTRLAHLGAEAVAEVVAACAAGSPPPARPQPSMGAVYARKLHKADGRLDWSQPATLLARRIRAFDPWPGTVTTLGGALIKVLAAEAAEAGGGPPGQIVEITPHLRVGTGEGTLVLIRVQQAGGRPQPAAVFAHGRGLAVGDRFD